MMLMLTWLQGYRSNGCMIFVYRLYVQGVKGPRYLGALSLQVARIHLP